jgi:hypothetical protein
MDGPESVGSSAVKTAIDTNATMIGKHFCCEQLCGSIMYSLSLRCVASHTSALSSILVIKSKHHLVHCSHARSIITAATLLVM